LTTPMGFAKLNASIYAMKKRVAPVKSEAVMV
jgi:hypothetical protein